MQQVATASLYYGRLDSVADYVLLATDDDEPVAKAYSAPQGVAVYVEPNVWVEHRRR